MSRFLFLKNLVSTFFQLFSFRLDNVGNEAAAVTEAVLYLTVMTTEVYNHFIDYVVFWPEGN